MNVVELLEQQTGHCGEQPALCHGRQVITFKELQEQSCRGANFFLSLGFKKGDSVLVFVPMSIDLYCILLSLWRIGTTAMFLDRSANRQTVQKCCSRINPKGLIGTPLAQLMRLKSPVLRRISPAITTGRLPFLTRWSHRKRYGASATITACASETPALITFTSGSTGIPKGTVRSHGFLMAQKDVLEKTLKLTPGKSDLATLPIFALINLACGVTTIIPPVSLKHPAKVATAPILKECAKYHPATAVASPAFFQRLLEDPAHTNLSCLKALYTGGAPVFPGLLDKLASALPRTDIVAVYGSTEAEPIAELRYADIDEDDLGKMAENAGLLAGTVVNQIDCRIITNNGNQPLESLTKAAFEKMTVQTGQPGEIVVHGKHVLTGYLDGVGDAENKFAVEGRIWHRTGDLGYFDASGRLWLLGRCSATIKDSKGVVYPFAIETAARQYQGITNAAFCLVDDTRVLVIETDATLAAARKQLEPVIRAFHIDRLIGETIPMDKRHNGKVRYAELLSLVKNRNHVPDKHISTH